MNNKKIENAIIVFTRLDSTRLPNKAFEFLGKKRLLDWCIDPFINRDEFTLVLATTDRDLDDPLIEYANKKGILHYRGDENNVAKRLSDCIIKFNINYFARINGDSPFVNYDLIKRGFDLIKMNNFDFVTNLVPRTYPYGMSLEVFRSTFYLNEYKNFTTDEHFEHVTKYFYEKIDQYNAYKLNYPENAHQIRLTVDTYDDLIKLNKLVERYPNISNFTIEELILAYNTI